MFPEAVFFERKCFLSHWANDSEKNINISAGRKSTAITAFRSFRKAQQGFSEAEKNDDRRYAKDP